MHNTMHGGFGYGERNTVETTILDFAIAYELMVINSHFKKEKKAFCDV